ILNQFKSPVLLDNRIHDGLSRLEAALYMVVDARVQRCARPTPSAINSLCGTDKVLPSRRPVPGGCWPPGKFRERYSSVIGVLKALTNITCTWRASQAKNHEMTPKGPGTRRLRSQAVGWPLPDAVVLAARSAGK